MMFMCFRHYATNTSTTLSIFENPHYFEFDPSASEINSVATLLNFSTVSINFLSGDILAVVEKNIGENINNDAVNGVISATQVLASTAYTTSVVTLLVKRVYRLILLQSFLAKVDFYLESIGR